MRELNDPKQISIRHIFDNPSPRTAQQVRGSPPTLEPLNCDKAAQGIDKYPLSGGMRFTDVKKQLRGPLPVP